MSDHMAKVWEDFQEPSGVRAQYYGGEIVMQANLTIRHDHIIKSIVRQVGEPFDAWGERGIDLGHDGTPRPDVAIVRLQDMDFDWRDVPAAVLQAVVEVVSSGKREWRDDWDTKRELYADHAIAWYLIVDPRDATWHLLQYQPQARVYTQHSQGIFGQPLTLPLQSPVVIDTLAWQPYPQ